MHPIEAEPLGAACLTYEIVARCNHQRPILIFLGSRSLAARARQGLCLLLLGLLRFPIPKPLQHCCLQANRAPCLPNAAPRPRPKVAALWGRNRAGWSRIAARFPANLSGRPKPHYQSGVSGWRDSLPFLEPIDGYEDGTGDRQPGKQDNSWSLMATTCGPSRLRCASRRWPACCADLCRRFSSTSILRIAEVRPRPRASARH